MSTTTSELNILLQTAKKDYETYVLKQKQMAFKFPDATIALETRDTGIEVHMQVEYQGTQYRFESIKETAVVVSNVFTHLDSQALVREKYADGKTRDAEESRTRVQTLSNRFKNKDVEGKSKDPNPYSGFVVSDVETDEFLGVSVLGFGDKPGISEMAFLNKVEAWSHSPIVSSYVGVDKKKEYQGVATTEVCTLLQYATFLKSKSYKIDNQELEAVVMTARLDNPGSWKAGAKGGMELEKIEDKTGFGSELRYHLRKTMK